jgi:glycosyltransferase involved in cell wall biosynthesis
MRILYFHQHFSTRSGSFGTRSLELSRALIARGHQVTMVCGQHARSGLDIPWDARAGWNRGTIEGIDVIVLPLPYSNRDSTWRAARLFLQFAWRSIGVALRQDHDLLFATSTPLTAALPGIVAKLVRPRIPFVFEVRDLWPELPRALGVKNPLLLGGMSVLEWLAYRCADSCIGLSPGIVEGIKRRAPAKQVVGMVPNGCDLDLFSPGRRGPIALPGVKPGDFVAGFTGAHGMANGLDAVLDAAAELKQRGRRDIKLVLIGDGGRKDALIARAKREDLNNCLFFPVIRKTEIAGLTASFDCGLQILANLPAFYYGTSPNKFFDYIAAGIPVVCNYPGWVAELLTKHEAGLAVPPDDPRALADALCRLADRREEGRQMGANARRLAEGTFSRERLAAEFVQNLESVARRTPDDFRSPRAGGTDKTEVQS